MAHGVFGVVLLKGLPPVLAEITKLHRCFRRGKPSSAAINRFHALGFERIHRLSHRAQIRVQHPDESAPQQEVEPAERDERGRIVEHRAGRILQHPPLLDETILHQVAETLALLRLLKNLFERLAPFEWSGIRFGQNRFENSRHVAERDFLVQQVFRRAHHKILHQQQINLVAVCIRLVRLL